MINIQEMVDIAVAQGYQEENAESKVAQDVVLAGIANSSLSKNITIKGGVAIRSISHNVRRATQDIDIDFIKYSLTDFAIDEFIKKINCIDEITIKRIGKIKNLKQQNYFGKRIFIKILDSTGDSIDSKIDIGVHKYMELSQEEFCFDIAFSEEGVNLLINTKEQMIAEKLKSLLKFGTASTRYKDVFDIWYLLKNSRHEKLIRCLNILIIDDPTMREKTYTDIKKRLESILFDREFILKINKSGKNWTDKDTNEVINDILLTFS